jgi:endonuclease YncB( thermonuclease family)
VLKSVDGGTMQVRLEGCAVRVRSVVMNTPETSSTKSGEAFGKEAMEANRRLVTGDRPALISRRKVRPISGSPGLHYVGDMMINPEPVR